MTLNDGVQVAMRKQLIATFAAISLVFSVATIGPPANASDQDVDLSDAEAVVSSIAPEVLAPEPNIASTGEVAPIVITGESDNTDVVVHAPENTAGQLTIGLESAEGAKSTSGDFTVISDPDSGHAQYVQPLPSGVRMLTAIESPEGPTAFTYSFDFGERVTAAAKSDGSILFLNSHGEPIGTVAAPWAVDASGKSLPTHYQWSGDTLTQTVDFDESGSVDYPVLADPAFTYNLVYTIGKTSALAIWKELHRCFNCNFPIDGAPKAYPKVGQILPLTVAVFGNFKCKFSMSYNSTAREESGFQFVALPGHIDGSGSVIGFDFYKRYTDNNVVLSVSANVLNSPFSKGTYLSVVAPKWGEFASNLINDLHLPIPPNTPPIPPK